MPAPGLAQSRYPYPPERGRVVWPGVRKIRAMKLEGRVAFITGGGSGLGRAMAQAFAREGAAVAVNDLVGDAAEETVAMLDGSGHRALAGDVTDRARVEAMVDTVADDHGRIDVLVNNAGVDKTPDDGWDALLRGELQLLHMSDDAWRRMLDIHLGGAFFCTRAVVPVMQRRHQGSVINLSSIAGLAGMGQVHYATAKGGLLGMTRSLARDLGPHGIRVNAICPGVIDTPMTASVPRPMLEPLIMATPLRRSGLPEEIAGTALWLASDDSSFVTGQAISPNGGIHIF
jgi:3-oxoacyl-[acyl-carrier protein] reductase